MPFGALGWFFGRPSAQRKPKRLFSYRHDVTLRALEIEGRLARAHLHHGQRSELQRKVKAGTPGEIDFVRETQNG